MSNIYLVTVLRLLARIYAPIIMPVLIAFASKDPEKTTHYGQDPSIQRYRLPRPFRFLETPDERSFGLYEPTVQKIYDRFGWRVAMYYWLAFRNVGHGIGFDAGIEVPKRLKDMTQEEQERYGIYTRRTHFAGLVFITGWKTVVDHYSLKTDNGFWAVRRISVRLGGQK